MTPRNEDLCDCRVIHQTRVNKAKETILAADKIDQLSQLFKALADPGRLKILLALEHDEMCVCDLAAFIGVSESAISHQLRMLRHLQLVANRREGPVLYYRLNDLRATNLLVLAMKQMREANQGTTS